MDIRPLGTPDHLSHREGHTTPCVCGLRLTVSRGDGTQGVADSRVSVGSSQERGRVDGREELGGQEVPSVALCQGLPTEPPLSSLGVLLDWLSFWPGVRCWKSPRMQWWPGWASTDWGVHSGRSGGCPARTGSHAGTSALQDLGTCHCLCLDAPPPCSCEPPRPCLWVLPCCLPSVACQLPPRNATLPNTSWPFPALFISSVRMTNGLQR